jgi:transketolase
MVFLTGDLGFMALEPLRDRLGDRFINCGVAEQNMVSVAAAMAREGLELWVYSIAPFCYARPFEQIRNDICMHNLPVRLLGNGGGYGYGVMGATHHALEDYGVLMTLPAMRVYAPAFTDDIADVVSRAGDSDRPCYIRLGRDERKDKTFKSAYSPWRCLSPGDGPVVITIGPLACSVLAAVADLDGAKPDVWLVSEMQGSSLDVPEALSRRISEAQRLCVVEEHVAHGGLGSLVCRWVVESGLHMREFRHLHSLGYPSDLSGSQDYLREKSGLGPVAIRNALKSLIAA